VTGRTESFAARAEDELRVRRERGVGRCVWCGKPIATADDYVHVGDRLTHSACTDRRGGPLSCNRSGLAVCHFFRGSWLRRPSFGIASTAIYAVDREMDIGPRP